MGRDGRPQDAPRRPCRGRWCVLRAQASPHNTPFSFFPSTAGRYDQFRWRKTCNVNAFGLCEEARRCPEAERLNPASLGPGEGVIRLLTMPARRHVDDDELVRDLLFGERNEDRRE